MKDNNRNYISDCVNELSDKFSDLKYNVEYNQTYKKWVITFNRNDKDFNNVVDSFWLYLIDVTIVYDFNL